MNGTKLAASFESYIASAMSHVTTGLHSFGETSFVSFHRHHMSVLELVASAAEHLMSRVTGSSLGELTTHEGPLKEW